MFRCVVPVVLEEVGGGRDIDSVATTLLPYGRLLAFTQRSG